MIEATSIKKMFRPYTPLEMAKRMDTDKDDKPVLPLVQGNAWSNKEIAFLDYTMPKSLVNYGHEESDTLSARMTELAAKATVKAFPVLMGETVGPSLSVGFEQGTTSGA
jgi:hypothetical protein